MIFENQANGRRALWRAVTRHRLPLWRLVAEEATPVGKRAKFFTLPACSAPLVSRQVATRKGGDKSPHSKEAAPEHLECGDLSPLSLSATCRRRDGTRRSTAREFLSRVFTTTPLVSRQVATRNGGDKSPHSK